MTSISERDTEQNLLSGMIGEGLAIGGLAAGWIFLVASTQWTGAVHQAVPVTLQAAGLVGLTAFLMMTFQPWSGGHVNPLMTMAIGLAGLQHWRAAIAFSAAHIVGALAGVSVMAAFIVDRPVFPMTDERVIAEFLGAAVVMGTIVALRNEAAIDMALATGAVIALVFWVSGGATLVNPAIALAQGIFGIGLNMVQAGPVIAAQFFGGMTGYYLARVFWP